MAFLRGSRVARRRKPVTEVEKAQDAIRFLDKVIARGDAPWAVLAQDLQRRRLTRLLLSLPEPAHTVPAPVSRAELDEIRAILDRPTPNDAPPVEPPNENDAAGVTQQEEVLS